MIVKCFFCTMRIDEPKVSFMTLFIIFIYFFGYAKKRYLKNDKMTVNVYTVHIRKHKSLMLRVLRH